MDIALVRFVNDNNIQSFFSLHASHKPNTMQTRRNYNFHFSALIVLSYFIQSCGLSADDIKKQELQIIDSTQKASKLETERIVDSVKSAAEQETIQKIKDDQAAMEEKNREAQLQHQREIQKLNLKNILVKLTTELEVQNLKLQDIEKPKFLRTPQVKEQQERQQITIINTIRQRIEECNSLLQRIDAAELQATTAAQ